MKNLILIKNATLSSIILDRLYMEAIKIIQLQSVTFEDYTIVLVYKNLVHINAIELFLQVCKWKS